MPAWPRRVRGVAPGLIAALAIGVSAIAVAAPATPCDALSVVDQPPRTVVSGFDIYAANALSIAADSKSGPARTVLLFGGWLTRAQLPHDAIYACPLLDAAEGPGVCGTIGKLRDAAALDSFAQHLNDPAAVCDTGGCRYAATVCVAHCGTSARLQLLDQVWVGRSTDAAGLFTRMVPFLVDGAAEPSIGELPSPGGRPVLYYTTRKHEDLGTIFAQPIEWESLTEDGPRSVVMRDKGAFAVSSVAYLAAGGCHLLVWNRLFPSRAHAPRIGDLVGITLAYALAGPDGVWSAPRALPLPAGAPCAALTPWVRQAADGTLALYVGAVTAGTDGICRLSNWSHAILGYRLTLR
jgi:hypothetical protein